MPIKNIVLIFCMIIVISCIKEKKELFHPKKQDENIINVSESDKLKFKKNITGKYGAKILSSIELDKNFITMSFLTDIEISLDDHNHLKLTIRNPSQRKEFGKINKIMFTETETSQNIIFKSDKEAIFESAFIFTDKKKVFVKDLNIKIEKDKLYINKKIIGKKVKKS